MRISFGIKLGIFITLLSVGLSSISLYYFYSQTYKIVITQLTEQLRSVGHVGTFLFDAATRESIMRLKAAIERDANFSKEQLAKLKPGDVLSSLSPEQIQQYNTFSSDYRHIQQILRKLNKANSRKIAPLRNYYPQEYSARPNAVLTYLIVETPESPDRSVLKFLASSVAEPQNEWPGNPIGNLYKLPDRFFARAFDGEAQVAETYYTDVFYTSITAAIPIKDSFGKTIAVLGLDFVEGSESDRLTSLKYICFAIVATSLVFSVLLSFLLARWLGRPIQQLQATTQKLRERDYSVTLSIAGNDEFSELAKVFNEMTASIRDYANALESANRDLEDRVERRTGQLKAANMKIQSLNEQLNAENMRLSAEIDIARRLQQMILPKEHELSQITDLDIAGFMESADEVGGDYYDVFQDDDIIHVGIGDVTGHGLESGVLMIMVQSAVRALLASGTKDPVETLSALNHMIYQNTLRMNSEKNLSFILLNYCNGILHLCGQHEEAIAIRANGTVERINTIDLGFPIGLIADIREHITQQKIHLAPGDGVILYTDGITEAENDRRQLYGLERLIESALKHWQQPARVIRDVIIQDLRSYIGDRKVFDDITVVVLKRK